MKKYIYLILLSCVIGFASSAGAYSYSFDFQSGGISLSVGENCAFLSVNTTDDLVIDTAFDLPAVDTQAEYTASIDMTLGLFGMFPFQLTLSDLNMGQFSTLDPTGFFGDGTSDIVLLGSQQISAQFGGYSLEDATLDFDITISPDQDVSGRYAVHIEGVSIYDGNTSELLSGIINELNQSGQSPIALVVPFTIPMTLSGTVDIQADPVPVPAAIWLFGAGLLGLAGIRRSYR